ncbi:GDP-mannose 4,6-dehydratase (plasmid) [Peteryoungia desertarenae]|uniref:GDP-mannose 4,6-dehydratase n=1 Tax=Peteryoungia desertarenae TaxID=1813451 RepID=A0ABX6QSY3_9HYPH|nr:GDP-mannose 4,6-dehydratase [Peteryoungia desertarenae]QLF71706.1 GDP-mannose 4,6-dehydratase [Peteryoungia desertarenae]
MPEQPRILVTGATGFVGTWLMRILRDLPVETSLELISAGRGAGCDVELDVTNKAASAAVLRDCRPTAVIHLAAIAAPQEARRDSAQAWDVNFHGTVNLASAVLNEAPDCRFIFAGSAEAYGQTFAKMDGAAVGEDCALKPMTVYGATKAAADIAVGQMYFDGLRSIRFRPFNHTGPGQTDSYVIPAFASQIARIEAGTVPPVIEVGNLTAQRDFLDVRDVVQAYALAALGTDRQAEGRVFNLASGKAVSIRSILDTLVRLSGRQIEVCVSPERVRPVDIPTACGDAHAAKRLLGWVPQIELEYTIQAVLSDWRGRFTAAV